MLNAITLSFALDAAGRALRTGERMRIAEYVKAAFADLPSYQENDVQMTTAIAMSMYSLGESVRIAEQKKHSLATYAPE